MRRPSVQPRAVQVSSKAPDGTMSSVSMPLRMVDFICPRYYPKCKNRALSPFALEMRGERLVHSASSLERRENDVGRDRRPPEDVLANGTRNGVQRASVPGADRRLADTSRAYRRFRVGDAEGFGPHRRRDVEHRQRLGLIEAFGERHAVV